ncbi:acetyltransferase [Cryobacterium glaciale]|uniref:Acetyltransferase n=1 Tax=Cryobacterium glaciale TaxID=1259145 RepID=A0A4R8UXY9_9MICO|nr:acyltransferase family protein [Cryobacterium glaciale]TFB73715.1 acetyltransferase [Cryobacterium glaciale]
MTRSPLSFPFTGRTRSTTATILPIAGPVNTPVLGPPNVQRSGRLAGLDGLRALAVIAVALYHFFPAILPGGFIGVDVFFVISGFLITGLLVSEHTRTGRISLRRFWQRRARRLVPPLVPVILASCSIAFLIGGDVLVGLGAQLLGATTFGYNWVSIANDASYFSVNEPELLRNLWSLAVEEQFYLVWPLLLLAVLLLRRPRVRLAVVTALFIASALWMGVLYQPGADPTRVYYGSDTHSFGLFAGAALALLLRRPSGHRNELPRLRPWLGAAAVVTIIGFALWLPENGAATYRGGLVAVSLATALAIWAGVRGGRFGLLLDSAPLRYLGERSYGIYLWHWPVLVLLQLLWPASSPAGSLLPIGLLATAITLVLAGVSYRWLELPIRSVGVRGSIRQIGALWTGPTHRRRLVAATAALSLLLVGGTTAAVVAAPAQTSAQLRIERGQRAMDAAARVAAQAAASEAARQATAEPALADGPITAIGDSVMLASAPELQATFAGITVDASVSRGMYSADDILLALQAAGQLQPVVVVGLGTNGPITDDELTAILRILGPDRQLVLVTAYAERDWTDGVNATLAAFAAGNRRVELANWHDTIAGRLDLLAGDHVHPGPTGGQLYADEVRAALDRLAAVPPLPDTSWLMRDPDAPRPPPYR